MINIEYSDPVINVAVLGEFTLGDFKQLEEHLLYKIRFQGRVNLLLDLRDMVNYTLDVAWEEIRFSREHASEFGRVAIVTDDQWMTWSAWLNRLFTRAEIQVFDEYEAAREWAGEESPGQ
jgi:stage II sporulation SpoAA-like protein